MPGKFLLLFTLHLPAWGLEFRKFDALPLGAQATGGVFGAGIGYLFFQSSFAADGHAPAAGLTTGQTLLSLSLGYTLGILFSGKIFRGYGNPYLTLLGNVIPFLGPLVAYHLSAGSPGFSESLALFNLSSSKLALGLPIPYRKASRYEDANEALYYANLVIINL